MIDRETFSSAFLNADCMEVMKNYPDNFFDLAIVDPPYGLMDAGMQSGGEGGVMKNRQFHTRHISKWDKAPNIEYFKELFRVSKDQIIWGYNYFELPPCRCFIVWDKQQPFETFSRCEIAWTSFKKPAKIFEYDNRYPGKIHPTQKPVALYRWILERYANPGDIILDTHVGSASSLIACHQTGHKYLGCEIDEVYYEQAKKRLEAEEAQTTIYDFIK